mmetsp:Transcript_66352/g.151778  ORF Transcript_66352/g.151778 Transcript_66352/m.151778 type:complete len:248 (-) Transcript_66352:409-1152(-)
MLTLPTNPSGTHIAGATPAARVFPSPATKSTPLSRSPTSRMAESHFTASRCMGRPPVSKFICFRRNTAFLSLSLVSSDSVKPCASRSRNVSSGPGSCSSSTSISSHQPSVPVMASKARLSSSRILKALSAPRQIRIFITTSRIWGGHPWDSRVARASPRHPSSASGIFGPGGTVTPASSKGSPAFCAIIQLRKERGRFVSCSALSLSGWRGTQQMCLPMWRASYADSQRPLHFVRVSVMRVRSAVCL